MPLAFKTARSKKIGMNNSVCSPPLSTHHLSQRSKTMLNIFNCGFFLFLLTAEGHGKHMENSKPQKCERFKPTHHSEVILVDGKISSLPSNILFLISFRNCSRLLLRLRCGDKATAARFVFLEIISVLQCTNAKELVVGAFILNASFAKCNNLVHMLKYFG